MSTSSPPPSTATPTTQQKQAERPQKEPLHLQGSCADGGWGPAICWGQMPSRVNLLHAIRQCSCLNRQQRSSNNPCTSELSFAIIVLGVVKEGPCCVLTALAAAVHHIM